MLRANFSAVKIIYKAAHFVNQSDNDIVTQAMTVESIVHVS